MILSIVYSLVVQSRIELIQSFLLFSFVKKAENLLIFFKSQVCLFPFFTMPHNDRGYGLGRSAGEFPVAIATKEMRAQRLPEAH